MSVQELIYALHGSYESTSVFSCEFVDKDDKTIAEIFLILPPENYSVDESPVGEVVQTFSGAYIADFGQAFKHIKIAGSSHFYYAGSSRNPGKPYGDSSVLTADDFVDGYTEFIKLRYMFSRYRDYFLCSDLKDHSPNFSLKELAPVAALQQKVQEFIDDNIFQSNSALSDRIRVIWHNYDYDDHFYVRIDNYSMNAGKGDPYTVEYDVSMTAYAVATSKAGSAQIGSTISTKKVKPYQQIQQAYTQSASLAQSIAPSTNFFNNYGDSSNIISKVKTT